MKLIALALFLLSAPLAFPGELPSFRSIPGHLVKNQCDPFSKAAVLMLHKQGIPARRILMKIRNPQAHTFHAALVFQHEGQFYVMDNEHRAPLLVKGKTDLSCALRLVGVDFYTSVTMADEYNRRVPPQKLADLFKPNPAWLDSVRIDKVDAK